MKTIILSLILLAGMAGSLSSQTARLQVIHNSADLAAAQVDVYLNGSLLLDDFAFRTATPYIDAPAGVPLTIDVAPGTSMSVAESIATFTVTLTSGETYVAVANGIVSASGYSPATAFDLHVYAMGREQSNVAGQTDVLVFHGSTDAPEVDVNEIILGGVTIVDNMSYGQFKGYLELPSSDYGLQILTSDQSTLLLEYVAPVQTLGLGDLGIVVLASGFVNPMVNSNGPAFGLYVALPTGGPLVALPELEYARLQVIHNSADLAAATVDVYFNGNLLLDDFAFRTASPFVDVPAGISNTVSIAPASSSSVNDAIADFGAVFAAGETYVTVANGIVSATGYAPSIPFNLYTYSGAREVATDPAEVDVMVFHGATDAPIVDVNEITLGATIIDGLDYSMFTGYLSLPESNYGLQILPDDQSAVVAEYLAPLEQLGLAGEALTVLASGFLSPANNSNGPGFGLYVALASGGALIALPSLEYAELQVIHNSSDMAAAEVDVYLNGGLLLDDFAFRTATPFVSVPALLNHIVTIAPASSTSVLDGIADFEIELMADEKYIAIANGMVSTSGYNPAIPFDLHVFSGARTSSDVTGTTDVLVFHGSTDAPMVDVVETGVGAGTLIDDLEYAEFAGYLGLQPLDYEIEVRTADQSVTAAKFAVPLQTLGLANTALTVVASGFLDPTLNSNGEIFGLFVALPSGGSLVELPSMTLNSPNLQSDKIALFPNPANDFINISGMEMPLVNIYTSHGVLLESSYIYNNRIDVSKLSQGLYWIELISGNDVIRKSLVINK